MKTQTKQTDQLTLQDENSFEFLGGLWTGKKPPYKKAVVIRNANFGSDGQIDYSKIAVLDVEAKQLQGRRLQNGDIIIERSGGGPKQPVGRVVYFDKETPEIDYSFSNFTSTIRVKDKEKFDSKYVFYFLYNFYAEGNTDHLQRRTTGIRNLDFSSYKESVVFPSIKVTEQKVIAQALTTVQSAIAGQEALIAKLKDLKRSMMQYLFTHGTKGKKTRMTGIGEVPEGWEVVELGTIFKFSSGKSRPKDTTKLRSEIYKYPVYGGNGILGYSPSNLFEVRKLIIGRVGEYCGCVHITEDSCWISDNALYAKEILRDINLDFYKYLLEHWKLNRYSNKMGQPLVTQGILSKVEVPYLDIGEQNAIANILGNIDQKTEALRGKLSAYQNLFKTLLHELMSGERRIKNI